VKMEICRRITTYKKKDLAIKIRITKIGPPFTDLPIHGCITQLIPKRNGK